MGMNLDELERLHKEATPGEWRAEGDQIRSDHGDESYEVASCMDWFDGEPQNAPYLAALHNAFPALLALARDGERYRWLRDRRAYVAIAPHSDHVPRNQRTGWTTRLITGNDENMDAAIDAARKGEKP